MKKHSILFIPLVMLLLTTTNCTYSSANTLNNPCVSGSGNATSEDRPVMDFSSVSVSTSGNLIVEQGETESLKITADDNLLPQLTSKVRNGHLILATTDKCIQQKSNIIYRVTVKNLRAVKVSGDVNVDLQNIDTDQLALYVDGNSSRFTASGKAKQLNISVQGDLLFNGESLSSTAAKVNISGDADVVINAADTLDVKISGDGSVNYIGNPTVTKHITGVGSVGKRS